MLLYLHDELGMSTIRLQLVAEGERVDPGVVYKVHAAELPVKKQVRLPPFVGARGVAA